MTTAVLAGSFDPPTRGHLAIIESALKIFDQLVIAVGVNPTKRYTFTAKQRIEMVERSCQDFGPGLVEVVELGNEFLAQWAAAEGYRFLVRGVRSAYDFVYEHEMIRLNRKIAPGLQTILLTPPPDQESTSSSLVKSLVGPAGWRDVVEPLVPECVMQAIKGQHAVARFCRTIQQLRSKYPHDDLKVSKSDLEVASLLVDAYQQKHRHYHTLDHILDCLELAERYKAGPEAEYALWLHDVVYDPMAQDNEEKSAGQGTQLLDSMGFTRGGIHQLCDRVSSTILATKTHGVDGIPLVSDIDMSILGTTPERYDRYSQQIRTEYGEVPDELYRPGRAKILKDFLSRPSIYHDLAVKKAFEDRARQNMVREVAVLEASAPEVHAVKYT